MTDLTEGSRAQDALSASESRFRSLAALTADWYWEQDEQLRFRSTPEMSTLRAGTRREDYVGKTRWELAGASLDDPRWAAHAALLARHEVFRDFEYERTPGRWVSVSGEPVFDAAGRFAGYRGVSREVTQRKRYEEALRRLGRLYAALSALNEAIPRMKGPEGLLQRACDIAASSGEFLRATIRTREAGTAWTRVAATSGVHGDVVARHPVSLDPLVPEGRTVVADVFRSGRVVVVTDLDSDARLAHLRTSSLLEGTRSLGVFPIRQRGEVAAVLILHGRHPEAFEGDMRSLLERMADALSYGLEFLDTEQRLRDTFERAGVGIAHVALDGRLLRVNPALCELLGYDAGELVGRSVKDISHPDDRNVTDEDRARLRSGEADSLRFEKRYLRKDGTPVWVWLTVALARNAAGQPAYEISFIEDVTARKRAEADRAKVGRMYASLSAVNELVSRALGERQLLQGACEVAVGSGAFQLALVRLADVEAGLGRIAAYSGPQRMPWLHRPLSLNAASPDAQSLALQAWRGRAPVFSSVSPDSQGSEFARQSAAVGTRSAAAFPLFRGRACIGALLLNSTDPDVFDGETRSLLERMAEAVSRGLDRLAADEALQRFRLAMDASADAIVLVDCTTLRFIDVNDTLCRLLGYTRAELLNMHAYDVLPISSEALRAAYAELIADPSRTGHLRSQYICKDGSRIAIESTRHVLRAGERWMLVAISRDTRERDRAEAERAALVERDQGLVQALGEIIYDWRPQADALAWEGDYERILGYPAAEMGTDTASWTSRVHPHDLRAVLTEVETAKRERRRYDLEYRFRHRDGRYLWMHDRGVLFFDERGELSRLLGVLVDVNARRQAENALLGIVQATAAPLLVVDREGKTLFANPAAGVLFGRPVAELENTFLGLPLTDSRPTQVEVKLPDGSSRTTEMQFVAAELGGRGVLVVSLHDLSERKRYEQHIERLANHDALTGLPNRSLLRDRVEQAIVHAQRTAGFVALMFVDLDQFKFVNDSWGHGAGDALLLEVGRRLSATMRAGDTVARLGGDEFVVLLCDLQREGDAALVAEKVAEALARPVEADGRTLQVSASIGISTYPGDGDDLDSLLQCADAAMYRAKDAGRNGYQYYSAEMGVHARLRVETEAGLRRALEHGELLLHYQPQVSLAGGEVRGFEALMRWSHPERGMVSPAQFIPVAEDSGLILPMGKMALQVACAQAAHWSAEGHGAMRVAVNLSARQFWRGSVAEVVREALVQSGLPADRLELEITESVVARDLQQVMRTLRELRAMGVSVAIDDFGTGYSSLAYLRSLPINKVKIDRSFIHEIPVDAQAAALVAEIIRLAHVLSLEVVAEGVETAEQARFLRDAGCEAMQGFYFSRPLSQADSSALLSTRRRLVID